MITGRLGRQRTSLQYSVKVACVVAAVAGPAAAVVAAAVGVAVAVAAFSEMRRAYCRRSWAEDVCTKRVCEGRREI